MPARKRNLIVFLVIEALLIALHNVLKVEPTSLENWLQEAGWHYWAALAFGLMVVAYAFRLTCANCGARQVFGGLGIRDIRWPGHHCWKCNHGIE